MTQEVKEYAKKRISESGIRMVHCPEFECREDVDTFIKITGYLSQRGREAKSDRIPSMVNSNFEYMPGEGKKEKGE